MNILIINAESGLGGGPANIANGIYNAAEEAGHNVLMTYGRKAYANSGSNLYRIGSDIDVKLHGVISRLFDAQGEGSIVATKLLIKKMEEFKPNLINLHNIHGYYLNYPMLFHYITKKRIPVVWTFHDCWPYTGHCANYDRVSCIKWHTQCQKCEQLKEYPKSLFIDRSKIHYRKKKKLYGNYRRLTIVTPSNWLKHEVSESFLKKQKCIVIHNGIDLKRYHPIESNFKRNYNIGDKYMILGVAATWGNSKGLDQFIKLSQILSDQYVIVLVGLTNKELMDLPSTIIGIQRTENVKELLEIYTSADVFVHASSADNFPTVILEALSCGTPVVTYDTGGCREALDEVCGKFVKTGDVFALAKAIEEMTHKDRTEACLKRIQSFEEKSKYKEYIDLFEKIVKKYPNVKA